MSASLENGLLRLVGGIFWEYGGGFGLAYFGFATTIHAH